MYSSSFSEHSGIMLLDISQKHSISVYMIVYPNLFNHSFVGHTDFNFLLLKRILTKHLRFLIVNF